MSIAYLVELIAGSVFGLHGIGWLIKGRWKTGLLQLVASIIVNVVFFGFLAPTGGFSAIPQLSLQVGWALYSARILNDDIRKQAGQIAQPAQTLYPHIMPPQLPAAQRPAPAPYSGPPQPQHTRTAQTWRPPQPQPAMGQRAVPSRPAQPAAPPIWPAQPTSQGSRPAGPMDTTIPTSNRWP